MDRPPLTPERLQLGAFLRAHRERLTPAAAGIQPGGSRRRTPGLRREEVAQLAGLSPTWYGWIEQGREVSASPAALARVAEVLQLTAAERAYLFELAAKRDPAAPAPQPGEQAAPAVLQAAVAALAVPAYLFDRAWNACGWNAPAAELFAGWLLGPERNLLRYVLLDASARGFIMNWEERARRLIAEFRADCGRRRFRDPELDRLITELRRASPLFERCWNEHAVLGREGGERCFDHPKRGLIRYQQLTLTPTGRPDYKLVVLLGPEL
jgi:transcriptional regulator with XRE-family HTH domain